jgi:hypothetical protein
MLLIIWDLAALLVGTAEEIIKGVWAVKLASGCYLDYLAPNKRFHLTARTRHFLRLILAL